MALSAADKKWINDNYAKKAHGHGDLSAQVQAVSTDLAALEAKVAALEGEEPDPPDPPKPPAGGHPVAVPAGLTRVFHDPCTDPNPFAIWGAGGFQRRDGQADRNSTSMAEILPDRCQTLIDADGRPFRRLTVYPTDQVWNARAALGVPDPELPPAKFHHGKRVATRFWMRIPTSMNISGSDFRQVFEWKHCFPFPAAADAYWTEVQMRSGSWVFENDWGDDPGDMHITRPFTDNKGEWLPIWMDAFWSSDPSKGWYEARFGNQTISRWNGRTSYAGSPKFLQIGPYQGRSYPITSIDYSDIEIWSN